MEYVQINTAQFQVCNQICINSSNMLGQQSINNGILLCCIILSVCSMVWHVTNTFMSSVQEPRNLKWSGRLTDVGHHHAVQYM